MDRVTRRFHTCVALAFVFVTSSAARPEQAARLREQLQDSAPAVRLGAATTLARANHAEAIPVLIDLLAELPADERRPVEEFLTQLAGEWAPLVQFQSDDEVSRRIRRAAWSGWWRQTDGPVLLAALDRHTLSPAKRKKIQGLLDQLGGDKFAARENATKELFAVGRVALPQLRDAMKSRDPEVSRRAKSLVERIEKEPAARLPVAAIRLLPVRKPAGAVEALLAYLPHAEEATYVEAVQQALAALAQRDGKPHPALLRSLADARPLLRGAVAAALAQGGGPEGRAELDRGGKVVWEYKSAGQPCRARRR